MLVLTTSQNHSEIESFFANHNYFGGNQDSFIFFQQRMLPALDAHGKILMRKLHEIALAPNGNGALLDAIDNCKEVQKYLESVDYV